MKSIIRLSPCLLLLFIFSKSYAQGEIDERAMIEDFRGMEFTSKEKTFHINFRFRMQNRVGLYTQSANDFHIKEVEARVRRLRLRMDGYIINSNLTYSIQLSFTRGDVDFENTGVVNIVRDAVMFYRFNHWCYLAFGLNKLPGNRQRVNSSGQLQFADRSIVNAAMNIDRDFGLKAYLQPNIGNHHFNIKLALTTGEGRSVNFTDDGLAYTGRLEWLPLGLFTREGDFSEGDLERESSPKLSIAGGYSFNHRTIKTGGQLGKLLFQPRDISTLIVDFLFKCKGWAYSAEFLMRQGGINPVTMNEFYELRYVYAGKGFNQQISYLFKKNYELAFRYSNLLPDEVLKGLETRHDVIEAGATKYIRNHRIKVQWNVMYNIREGNYRFSHPANHWGTLFQVEFGI